MCFLLVLALYGLRSGIKDWLSAWWLIISSTFSCIRRTLLYRNPTDTTGAGVDIPARALIDTMGTGGAYTNCMEINCTEHVHIEDL